MDNSRFQYIKSSHLIFVHGPHVPRVMEVHKKRLIAYSLGNFCTYGRMNLSGEMGYASILWVELNKEGECQRSCPDKTKPDEVVLHRADHLRPSFDQFRMYLTGLTGIPLTLTS